MSSTEFRFNGTKLQARASGALWWPEANILCVSDLHLGRSERLARRGGMLLPPYETRETLAKLDSEISELAPQTVICLGDSFDDLEAAARIDEADRRHLTSLMAGRRWIWVEGNHDPADNGLGGSQVAELERGPLTFRHIAVPRTAGGEVSGHYHPKVSIATRAGRITRPCFIFDETRLMLPAYGAYTGGLKSHDPALQTLFSDAAVCITAGGKTRTLPLKTALTA